MIDEKKPAMNLLPVGFIYFFLFSISVWIDTHRSLFLFPKLDDLFFQHLAVDCLLGILIGVLITGITVFLMKYFTSLRELAKYFQEILGPLRQSEIFFISAFSSLGEEFFFRGFIQGELGLVVASIFFGFLHVGPGKKFFPWTIFAVLVGFVLGLSYEWRNNLFVPVMIHFTVNYLNLIGLEKWAKKPAENKTP